jgi:hypothetical protein
VEVSSLQKFVTRAELAETLSQVSTKSAGIVAANSQNSDIPFRSGWWPRRDYEKTSKHNFPGASAELGLMYLNGDGVAKDFAKAISLLEASAKRDEVDGELALGKVY